MQLSEIKLGYTDGAQEARMENFTSLFYEDDEVVKQLKTDNSIFIITGRKGVGKTLLSEYYMNYCSKEFNSICATINANNILETYLKEFGTGKIIDNEEFVAFIKFHIYKSISEQIFQRKIRDIKIKNRVPFFIARERLRCFVKKRYSENNFCCDEFDVVKNGDCNLNINKTNGNIGVQSNKRYKKNRYYNILDRICNLVFDCLKYTSVVISNDDLDEIDYSNITNGKDSYIKFLLRYIQACKELNLELSNHSKCLVVIRDDILNSLNSYSGNFNKTISDCSVRINWIESQNKRPWEYKMAKMVLKKIRASSLEYENCSDQVIYEALFPEKVLDHNTFETLMAYSYGRPRAVIYWLLQIIKDNGEKNMFSEDLFKETLPIYSEHLLGELKNELNYYYEPEYIDQLFETLSIMNKCVFKIQNFEYTLVEHKENLSQITSAEDAIKVLYEIGALGNKVGNKTDWYFRTEGKKKPNINEKFVVHLGLRKVLIASQRTYKKKDIEQKKKSNE